MAKPQIEAGTKAFMQQGIVAFRQLGDDADKVVQDIAELR